MDAVEYRLPLSFLFDLSFWDANSLGGSDGVPNAYYFGQEGMHNILVIDMLGPSLEDLFDICGRQFSPKTVAMVAKQMVSTCFFLFSKGAHSLI